MFTLIIVILMGLGIAFFSQQNTQTVQISIGNYVFSAVPVYLVVISSMLIGLFISWIISLMNFFSTSLLLRKKDSVISNVERKTHQLEQRIEVLLEENEKLKAGVVDEHKSTFFDSLKQKIAIAQHKEVLS